MNKKPLDTCSEESCAACEIRSLINCNFTLRSFFIFYGIVSPALILGGISLYTFPTFFFLWFLAIGLFFLLIGTRVLCTHCPLYNKPASIMKCQANYGLPKLWKRRPWPMSSTEKVVLISGHALIWCYPAAFMLYHASWALLTGYLGSVLFFFIMLRHLYCKKCVNISCPWNAVSRDIKELFLRINPELEDHGKSNTIR